MTTEQMITDIVNKWDKALAENDVPEMSSYMTGDWVCLGGNGLTTREAFLAAITSGDLVHNRMDSDEIHIKVYGDTAIVSSRGTSAGTWKGAPFDLYEWSASVFVKQDDKWLCVHTTLTPTEKI